MIDAKDWLIIALLFFEFIANILVGYWFYKTIPLSSDVAIKKIEERIDRLSDKVNKLSSEFHQMFGRFS